MGIRSETNNSSTLTIAVGQTATATGIGIGEFNKGLLKATDLTGTVLNFHASTSLNGTYTAIESVPGTTAKIDYLAGAKTNWQVIPDAAMKADFLKIVSGTTQAGSAATFEFIFKT